MYYKSTFHRSNKFEFKKNINIVLNIKTLPLATWNLELGIWNLEHATFLIINTSII
jgi:hypothetical protein